MECMAVKLSSKYKIHDDKYSYLYFSYSCENEIFKLKMSKTNETSELLFFTNNKFETISMSACVCMCVVCFCYDMCGVSSLSLPSSPTHPPTHSHICSGLNLGFPDSHGKCILPLASFSWALFCISLVLCICMHIYAEP